MIRRLMIAAALAASSIASPAIAQDSLATSTAPAPTQVRLPLVRLIANGDRVVMQVLGSTDAPNSSINGLYVGPSGYVADIAQATDVRGPAGSTSTTNAVPGPMGAPGKSAYQSWVDQGNIGTEADFVAALRGMQGIAGGIGPAGPQGSQGVQGPAGAIGDRGPAGPAGAQGPAGPKGDTGSTGAAGPRGADGAAGPTGADGPAGPAGPQGLPGATGATGLSGATGATGAAGTAASISIGTVTTLAAGSTPTVTNGGTSSAAVLNFGLPRSAIYLTDVALTQNALVAISAGPRTLTVSTNCAVGDRLVMSPAAAMPAGYMLGDIFCSAAGTAQATLYAPLLAIGASYSITVKVTAFR